MTYLESLAVLHAAPNIARLRYLCSDDNPDVETRAGYREMVIARASNNPLPFPSIAAQVASGLVAAGQVAAQFLEGKPAFVASDEYERRTSICAQCEHLREGRCGLCACWISLKASLASKAGHCPIEKW